MQSNSNNPTETNKRKAPASEEPAPSAKRLKVNDDHPAAPISAESDEKKVIYSKTTHLQIYPEKLNILKIILELFKDQKLELAGLAPELKMRIHLVFNFYVRKNDVENFQQAFNLLKETFSAKDLLSFWLDVESYETYVFGYRDPTSSAAFALIDTQQWTLLSWVKEQLQDENYIKDLMQVAKLKSSAVATHELRVFAKEFQLTDFLLKKESDTDFQPKKMALEAQNAYKPGLLSQYSGRLLAGTVTPPPLVLAPPATPSKPPRSR